MKVAPPPPPPHRPGQVLITQGGRNSERRGLGAASSMGNWHLIPAKPSPLCCRRVLPPVCQWEALAKMSEALPSSSPGPRVFQAQLRPTALMPDVYRLPPQRGLHHRL